jgi:hypothetical protein
VLKYNEIIRLAKPFEMETDVHKPMFRSASRESHKVGLRGRSLVTCKFELSGLATRLGGLSTSREVKSLRFDINQATQIRN